MAVLDAEKLLIEVSGDSPAGEDLEYDPAFGELERAAQGKPEQQFGGTLVPAEEPDWKDVKKKAVSLFDRTRDLRVATFLTQATVHTDGLPGLRDSLKILDGLVEKYWDTVHPELDPDDDNDPTMRVNILVSLCDSETMLKWVKEAPLVSARGFGSFSLRDMQLASGSIQAAEGTEVPEAAAIDGAFMETELEDLEGTAAAVTESADLVESIEQKVTEAVGASQAPNLTPLVDVLHEVGQALADRLSRRGVGSSAVEAAGGDGAQGAAPGATRPAAGVSVSGDVASREDVVRLLDKACEYFRRYEPSSPVPLLLERAKRLVSKNFLEIIRDLAPDGLTQVQNVGGVEPE